MRIGEIATNDKQSTNHELQLSDVVINSSEQSIIITFNSYKHKKDHIPFRLRICNDKEIDVFNIMSQYLRLRGSSDGPLFKLQYNAPVKRKYFSEMLAKCLKKCNLSPNLCIKPHSFRIGAATRAIQLGFNEEQVRFMGKWKTQAFKSYIRIQAVNC